MGYNQANNEMKQIVLFLMVLIPLMMNAQNTSLGVQPSAFVGTYSFVDADGSQGTVTLNSPSKTITQSWGNEYYGTGTCVFNGVTSYFSWQKRADDDNVELRFSFGDLPLFTVNGNPYKNNILGTLGTNYYYIKNGWLYYDNSAMAAENPNLRFKLTKK